MPLHRINKQYMNFYSQVTSSNLLVKFRLDTHGLKLYYTKAVQSFANKIAVFK